MFVHGHRCEHVCLYVLVCFQKRHDLQGTSAGYPTSQHNTVSTSPFDDLSPYLLKKSLKPLCAYIDLFCLHICSTLIIVYGIETTNTSSIFLAFGPFSFYHSKRSFFYKSCTTLPQYIMFLIPLDFISLALY